MTGQTGKGGQRPVRGLSRARRAVGRARRAALRVGKYGARPRTIEEFYRRFEGLCDVLLDDPGMFGYCYTQLTDVYQEQNGIYTFDRRSKFDLERLRQIQRRAAAIEQDN